MIQVFFPESLLEPKTKDGVWQTYAVWVLCMFFMLGGLVFGKRLLLQDFTSSEAKIPFTPRMIAFCAGMLQVGTFLCLSSVISKTQTQKWTRSFGFFSYASLFGAVNGFLIGTSYQAPLFAA